MKGVSVGVDLGTGGPSDEMSPIHSTVWTWDGNHYSGGS